MLDVLAVLFGLLCIMDWGEIFYLSCHIIDSRFVMCGHIVMLSFCVVSIRGTEFILVL